jgi:hypothetical protein
MHLGRFLLESYSVIFGFIFFNNQFQYPLDVKDNSVRPCESFVFADLIMVLPPPNDLLSRKQGDTIFQFGKAAPT